MLSGYCCACFGDCSTVWCSAADTDLKPLNRVVSSACFLTDGVLERALAHSPSVAVVCMLYKIRCKPMHPLCGALPVPYVPVRVTRCALVAHRYAYAPPRCRTSQYRRTFIPFSVSLWIYFGDAVLDSVGLEGLKSRANALLLARQLAPFSFSTVFPFSCLFIWVGIVGLRSLD